MSDIKELTEKLLEQECSEEMKALRLKAMQRIIEETEVLPTRIPAPANITQVGGYYNLLSKLEKDKTEMRMKLIASALGIPI